jgi:hypothetical protein
MNPKSKYSLVAAGLILAFSLIFSLNVSAQDMPSRTINADPTSLLPGESYFQNSDGGTTYGCTNCHQENYPNGFDFIPDVTIYFASGHANTLAKTRSGLNPTIYPTASDPYGSGSIFDWVDGTISVGTGAPSVNTNPANQNPDGSYKYYGTTQPLYYVYGGWSNQAQVQTIFQNGFTGQLYPNGNFDCARCHTTGYNFDASGPEPTTANLLSWTTGAYSFTPITDAEFSRVPTDGFIAPGTNGTSSWYLTAVQCARCHNGMGFVTNQSATALCIECHREETVNTTAHTITPGNGLTGSAYSYLLVSDHGSCSDGKSPNYQSCTTAGNKWNYVPSLDHSAGPTFLNSPHARFSGTLAQNRQNSPDLSVVMNGTYNSQFTDAMVRTAGDPTKNAGCVGCHDPHVTTVGATSLNNNNVPGSADHPAHNCSDCHALAQTIMQTTWHPFFQGTPFPTGTPADINGSCMVCHMQAASGVAGNHLFRISTDPNYSTFPTRAQLYSPTNPQTTPNTATDGILPYAVWEDVDLACGQCHVGGSGNGNPYGLTVPPGSSNARVLTKAELADYAANGYPEYPGSGAIHNPDPTVATPTFAPNPGTYNTTKSVTLSDTTSGATIYYTVDGSTPTIASTQYTGAIPVTADTTIKAIAVAQGYLTSYAANGAYTLQAVVPTLSPNGGYYTAPQSVALSDITPGVTIYYTTDGSAPTTASTSYSGPIALLSSPITIKAIAAGGGFDASTSTQGTYYVTFPVAAAPTFTPPTFWGPFTTPTSVTITDTTPGVTIYYTTDNSTPTTASTKYTGLILVSTTTTIKAMAAGGGYLPGSVTSATYPIVAPAPTFTPPTFWGPFTAPTPVTITDTAPGVTIYYTTNGSTPTTASTKYTGPITVSTTTTINAMAAGGGYAAGAVTSGTYTIVAPTPTFSPGAFGTFTPPTTVTITDAAPGVTIYYTKDGSTPTTASPQYAGPFTVSTTTTIKAIAAGGNYGVSAVASGTYTEVVALTRGAPGVANPGYTITPSSTSVLVNSGGTASVTINLASTTFADSVALTATPSSPAIAATLSRSTATLAPNGSDSVTLTVAAPSNSANRAPARPFQSASLLFCGVLLGAPVLLGIPLRNKRRALAALLVVTTIVLLGLAISCGGGSSSNSNLSSNVSSNYTVLVMGTGGVSSTINVAVK